MQTANPLIQTTKTLEKVIELQRAIINYEDEEQCIRVREETTCCTEYQPTTSDGYCKLPECKHLTDIKDAIGYIFVTLVILNIQGILWDTKNDTYLDVDEYMSSFQKTTMILDDISEIQYFFKNSIDESLRNILIYLVSIAKDYNLTLKECAEYAYEQIKNIKAK